jgi:hypothetical protein
VQALVEEFLPDVPVIEDEGIHIADPREREVDVSRDPMRMIIDRFTAVLQDKIGYG